MKQITVICETCVECPYYEPQTGFEMSEEWGECQELGELVNGFEMADNCPFPDA